MNKLSRNLTQVSLMTFQNLCFLFPIDNQENEEQIHANKFVSSQVDFEGPQKGSLKIQVNEELLSTITSNILGEKGIYTLQQKCDALGEIANIICGNMLPFITNSSEIHDIKAPKAILNDSMCDVSNDPSHGAIKLKFDDGQVGITFHIQQD